MDRLDSLLDDPAVRSKNNQQIIQYAKEKFPEISIQSIKTWLASKPSKQLRGKHKWNSFVPLEARQEFQVDVATMTTKQASQDKYMLVAVDPFTKFIWAEPMDSKETKETARALQVIISKMGIPASIITDMGGEYNLDFTKELDYYEIEHLRFRTHPNFVERAIRTIKDRLRQALGLAFNKEEPFFNFTDWAPHLPHVLKELNEHTKSRITDKEPQDVVDEFDGDASLEDKEVLRKHLVHRLHKHATFNMTHDELHPSEENGSLVKVRERQQGPNSIGRQSYMSTTYRVTDKKYTGNGPLYKLKVFSEPEQKEDTHTILTNPNPVSGSGEKPDRVARWFPRHELLKVPETKRTAGIAPLTNQEYEIRAEFAPQKERIVRLLKQQGHLSLNQIKVVNPKKFVVAFRDIFRLEGDVVYLRETPLKVPVLEITQPLSPKQLEMKTKLEPFSSKLVELLKKAEPSHSLRVSDQKVKDWFETVALYIKNTLHDRESGITKLSSVLVLYPEKFQLTENRTLITLKHAESKPHTFWNLKSGTVIDLD
jgi:transposase-like protein